MEEVVGKAGRVLTYPRKLLGTAGSSGHMAWYPTGPDARRVERLWSWTERPAAETSVDLVQPIPCAVIVDGAGRCCILQHAAKDSGLGGLSLMVGGHVDEEDARDSLEATLMACLVRELAEEVDLLGEPAPLPLGVAVDARSTALSRHVGYIYVKDAERIAPKTFGRDQGEFDLSGPSLSGEFATGAWLDKNVERFDPWSAIFIRLRERILGR